MVDVQSLLTVRDMIKDKPIFVTISCSAVVASSKMKENSVTSILAKDDSGDIIGIVTETDIVHKVVAGGKNPSEMDVKDIMTGNLLTIDGNDSMFKARQIMVDNKVRHLVVTDDGKQIGVVTSKEILGN